MALAIADANQMAGCLLSHTFKRNSGIAVVSWVTDKASFLKSVRETKPDVVIIGADLEDGRLSGLEALRGVHESHPEVRSILLFDRPEPQMIIEGLRAGARGIFLRSNFDFAALCKCVRRVHEGQLWINNSEMEHVVEALTLARPLRLVNPKGLNLLSKREEDVMRLVAEGLGNRDIAEQLKLSEHTVKNYLFHIFEKLGVSNRVELVLYAVSNSRDIRPVISEPEEEDSGGKAFGQGVQ